MIITFILSAYYDLLEAIVAFAHQHEDWQVDELMTLSLVLVFLPAYYAVKRWRELVVMNQTMETKNDELKRAFGEIKQFKGILPICASCRKIRDDEGYWHQVEEYIRHHMDANLNHSICPECMKKLYPGFVGFC